MATIRSSKAQITLSLRKLDKAVDDIDNNVFSANDLSEPTSPNKRLNTIVERKAALIELKTRIELLLASAKNKLTSAFEVAKNFDSSNFALLQNELDEHWDKNNGDEIEEKAEEVLIKVTAQLQKLDVFESNILKEIDNTPKQPYPQEIANASKASSQLNNASSSCNQMLHSPQNSPSIARSNGISEAQATFRVRDTSVTPAVEDSCNVLPSQLQKLEVEPFFGDIGQFSEFWCTFDTLIHSNPNIPISAKFGYLKLALKGNTSHVIQRIHNSRENYELAIELLHKRFNKPQSARNFIFQQLKDLPHASVSSISQRNTLCQIQSLIAQLSRYEDNNTATSTLRIVLDKFPERTRLEVAKREHASGTIWTLEQLLAGLDCVVEELEAIESYQASSPIVRSEYPVNSASLSGFRSTSPSEQDHPVCCFCLSRKHSPLRCRGNFSARDRRRIVRMHKLCWKCFREDHASNACTFPSCATCGQDHNILLCDAKNKASRWNEQRSPRVYRDGERRRSPSQSPNRHNRSSSRESHGSMRSSSYDSHDHRPFRSLRSFSPAPQKSVSFSPSRKYFPKGNHASYARTNDHQRDIASNFVNIRDVSDDSEQESHDEFNCFATNIHRNSEWSYDSCSRSLSASPSRLMLVNANVYNARTRSYEALTVLLDSGSQPSFITTSAVYRLGLSVSNRQSITLVTLGGHASSEPSGIVDTRFKDRCGEEFYLSLFVKDVLTTSQSTAALGRKDRELLASLGIKGKMLCGDAQLVTPEILIGMDHYWKILTRKPSVMLPSGLVLTYSRFGPVISGKETFSSYHSAKCAGTPSDKEEDNKLNEEVNRLWSLETIGITDDPDPAFDAKENERIIKEFYETAEVIDGYLHVRFPWKPNHPPLADNKKLAYKRLQSQYKSLIDRPDLLAAYAKVFNDQLASGIIEEVNEDLPNQGRTKQ